LMFVSRKILRPLFLALEEAHGRYRSDQLDAIKGIEAVKVAGGEGAFRDALLARFLGLAEQTFRGDFTVLAYQGALTAITFLSSMLFLGRGARLTRAGALGLGAFVAFNALVAKANEPIRGVLGVWDKLQLVKVLWNRLADVFAEPPEQGEDRTRLK